jgi:hypothetical protein
MSSKVFRTASSSVVALKDGRLLEVRRGTDTGSKLTDRRTWENQNAWLGIIGEPLVPEKPVHEDYKFMISLVKDRFPKSYGQLFIKHTNKNRLVQYEKDIKKCQKNIAFLTRVALNASGLCTIPHVEQLLIDYKYTIQRGYGFSRNARMQFNDGERHAMIANVNGYITCLTEKKEAVAKLVEDEKQMPHYYKYKDSHIFVQTMDGLIKPVYYHGGTNVFGVYDASAKKIHIGRSFDDLHIKPVRWYVRVDGDLTPIDL